MQNRFKKPNKIDNNKEQSIVKTRVKNTRITKARIAQGVGTAIRLFVCLSALLTYLKTQLGLPVGAGMSCKYANNNTKACLENKDMNAVNKTSYFSGLILQ